MKKTTGGRAWIPRWGLRGLTPTQKANRKKQLADEAGVREALKEAAANAPAPPQQQPRQ